MFRSILTIIGITLLVSGLVGIALQDNPVLSLIPGVGEYVKWLVSSAKLLIPIGTFVASLGLFRSFIPAIVITVVVYLVFMFAGVL
jgi:hypothetical protein